MLFVENGTNDSRESRRRSRQGSQHGTTSARWVSCVEQWSLQHS